jgi:hypothetical protein
MRPEDTHNEAKPEETKSDFNYQVEPEVQLQVSRFGGFVS